MITRNFDLLELFIRLLVLIPAFTIHEMAHGIAAYLLGDRTAKDDGRISLNPIKHIDPVGFLAIMLFGFGWAKPVMIDPRRFKQPKFDMAITALAGPVSNFIFALITLFVYAPLIKSDLNIHPIVFDILGQLFSINIALGVFNLLPIPPLDGSKVLGAFLPDNLYWSFTSMRNGIVIIIILSYTGLLSRIILPTINFVSNSFVTLVDKIF